MEIDVRTVDSRTKRSVRMGNGSLSWRSKRRLVNGRLMPSNTKQTELEAAKPRFPGDERLSMANGRMDLRLALSIWIKMDSTVQRITGSSRPIKYSTTVSPRMSGVTIGGRGLGGTGEDVGVVTGVRGSIKMTLVLLVEAGVLAIEPRVSGLMIDSWPPRVRLLIIDVQIGDSASVRYVSWMLMGVS